MASGYIEKHLTSELEKIGRENLVGLERPQLVERLTYFLSEINAAHPFREGDGRTHREFIRELTLQGGHTINWTNATRDALYAASEESMGGNLTSLSDLIDGVLQF